MPILMILLLTAACLPAPWPRPFDWLDATDTAFVAGGFVFVSVLLSAFGCYRVIRLIPLDRGAAVNLYFRLRRWLAFGSLCGSTALVPLGWGWAVRELASDDTGRLAPFAEVLVPGPYLLILLANWFVWYFAERAMHRSGSSTQPFWGLPAYILQQARQFVLLLFMPVFVIASQQSFSRHAPESADSTPYQIAVFVLALGLLLGLPLVLKRMLGLKRMPDGPSRTQLTATAKRLRFRCREWLLWPTRGLVANAMIVGVIPQARFVIFTDRLLTAFDPPELDAVVGHEIGHARHWHIPYYFAFFGLSSLVAGTIVAYLESLPQWPKSLLGFGMLFGVLGLELYIFVVFGFLSRICERQADLVGVKAASCGDPHCVWHTPETVLADGGNSICPNGVRAMIRALDLVMQFNGLDRPERGSPRQWLIAWWKSWQHGPPSHRIDFLLALIEHPERAASHDRYAFRVRAALLLLLIGVLAGVVSLLGWDEFWKQM